MELRPLGKSAVNVSPVIFGAWAIGGWMWGGSDETSAIKAIQASLEHGVNTIDTAPIYGMGLSEELVGKAIQGIRDKVVLATKCGMRWDTEEGSDPWQSQNTHGQPIIIRKNLRPASIFYECEQSLKRLKTDVIDLYQIHWPDSSTPIEDAWNAMVKLKKQGKVRAIGVCNFSLEQLKVAHAMHPVDSLQSPYSLIRRDLEQDIIPFCKSKKISVLAYSPLERGLLTGKYRPHQKLAKGDHRAEKPTFSPHFLTQIIFALSFIHPLVEQHHSTLAQLIINCTIHRPGITAALVGARNPLQAIENAHAMLLNLSHEEREFIAKALSLENIQRPLYD